MLTIALAAVFIVAYLCIAFEHPLRLNKAATAVFAGALSWGILAVARGPELVEHALVEHTAAIAGIIFFIIGAMTIVEEVDSGGGFLALRRLFAGRSYTQLTWLVTGVTFALSSVLDNLTTAIVMTSVVVRLVSARRPQLLLAGLVIIAANSGGAWSPIGDVTTTMLWVGGQVSTQGIVSGLWLPSLVSAALPALLVTLMLRSEPVPAGPVVGARPTGAEVAEAASERAEGRGNLPVLVLGIALLVAVPFVKTLLHVPPYVAMLASLGVLWIVTELRHRRVTTRVKRVASALGKIDHASVLFFLGILLTVAALDTAGVLRSLAEGMGSLFPDERVVAAIIGVASAVVDNVPLVAGSIGMYDLSIYPQDHRFWTFLAYCAGTGGSMLVIGSAAGVAAMGIAKLEFGWYAKVIGPLALAGYVAGLLALVAQSVLG
jgi:Na+/H+ antiporter NhaD/arsenite permease-like protein